MTAEPDPHRAAIERIVAMTAQSFADMGAVDQELHDAVEYPTEGHGR
jgi:hypothetical protein